MFGPPAPQPRQVFAIGLNYFDHAEEAGMEPPTDSMVVAKLATPTLSPFMLTMKITMYVKENKKMRNYR